MKKIIELLIVLIMSAFCFALVSNAADTDRLILDASDLAQCTKVNDTQFTYETTVEGDKAYIVFTTSETGTAGDGTQIEFDFTLTGATKGCKVKDYPFVKIGYKSDIAGENARIDLNYGLYYQGISTRIWGYVTDYSKNGKDSTLIFDVREVFSGGEGITDYKYENIDGESECTYIRLKPYYRTAKIDGETFSVEYIGFFKTKEDAENYMHKIDKTITALNPSFGYYKLKEGDSFDLGVTCLPTYASLGVANYVSSDETVATVDANGKVTALGKGKADITVSTSGTDATAVTHVIVEEDKPLDIYSKNFADGQGVIVNVLGDSISYDTAPNEKSSKYHGVWAGTFKMSVNNWSLGGSAVTGNITTEDKRIETFVPRLERMIVNDITGHDTVTSDSAPDLFVVWGGTNDYNGYWPIGSPEDRTRNTYCGAISEIIELVYKNYPDSKLVFFTPIKRTDYKSDSGYDNTGKRAYELDAYVDAMIEMCKLYNVTCIDLYNNEQTDFIGLRSVYINDGVHLSAEGHRIFAAVTVEEMEKAGIIKTHGYTVPEATVRELSADRSTSADYYIFSASQINGRTRYDTSTMLDRQRLSKHTYTDGAIRFNSETLTSSIAPAISVSFKGFSFAPIDYPYMTVVYKTSSSAEKINVSLRGNNNHVSKLTQDKMPDLVSGETASFTINLLDYACEDIQLSNDSTYTDLYYTMEFFNSTKEMTADSYVDIIGIGFFKDEEVAKSYDGENVKGSGFTDTLGHWACDSIDYAVKNGLFAGVTKTEFKPDDSMTRGMLVTVLSRLANDTENKTAYPFKDVPADSWFAPGVSFAYSNGIVDADEAFRPNDSITREEIADMLYRYAKKTGKTLGSAEIGFADADKIDADKRDAIAYCVHAGIIKGYDNNTVNPEGKATRAEVAALLERFMSA